METFQALLEQKVAETLSAGGFSAAGMVTPTAEARFGDYQSNAALILGKQRGENPREIAQKICDLWVPWDLCERPTIAGPGFINFTLHPQAIAARTAELLGDERLGAAQSAAEILAIFRESGGQK